MEDKARTPIWIYGETEEAEHLTSQRFSQFVQMESFLTVYVVPLSAKAQIIGFLSIGSQTRHKLSQTENDTLIAIGQEIGLVIAKLRTENALRDYSKHLEQLVREMTAQLNTPKVHHKESYV